MNDKIELIVGSIGTGLSAVGTATQTNQILQTISLIITIIGGIISMIVIPIINWYRKAKADGKITADEIKDLVDVVKDGTEQVSKDIHKGEDK